ncbi:MAG: hypothetical protein M0C28_47060 [Candidatus Moduliflexus flocculans]|nr:hypothetical protein [Candidatus Moduliflexus flocculans]
MAAMFQVVRPTVPSIRGLGVPAVLRTLERRVPPFVFVVRCRHHLSVVPDTGDRVRQDELELALLEKESP